MIYKLFADYFFNTNFFNQTIWPTYAQYIKPFGKSVHFLLFGYSQLFTVDTIKDRIIYEIYFLPYFANRTYSFLSLLGNLTFIFTLKLALCLALLIVIRGCIPRYRYDVLTKLGWNKLFTFAICLLIFILILYLSK